MNPSRSVYTPLDNAATSIRLIEVLPQPSHQGYLRIRMRQAHTPTEYRCLSYTWGSTSSQGEILVNDQIVRVRRNLYKFLKTAQHRFAEQPLWIDALCINQSDEVEKSQQVQRMGEIYNHAAEVLIWLGAEKELDPLFDFCNAYSSSKFTLKRKRKGLFRKLTSNEYWSRTWIAQEIILARQLVVINRRKEMTWGSLLKTVLRLLEHYKRHSETWAFLKESRINRFARHRSRPVSADPLEPLELFWELLSHMSESKCGDPRDRIYGLLSLLGKGEAFAVNYGEDVYSLFWRAGEHFRAWTDQNKVRLLGQSLRLTSGSLRDHPRGYWRKMTMHIGGAFTMHQEESIGTSSLMICCPDCGMGWTVFTPDDTLACLAISPALPHPCAHALFTAGSRIHLSLPNRRSWTHRAPELSLSIAEKDREAVRADDKLLVPKGFILDILSGAES